MSEPQTPATPRIFKLTEIGPLGVGTFCALLGLLGGVAYGILMLQGFHDPDFAKGLAIVATALGAGALGGFLGGLILAVLYNLTARHLGGVHVRLLPVDESQVQGFDAFGTKQCPGCQAQIRADRSFCPHCDHHFPRESEG